MFKQLQEVRQQELEKIHQEVHILSYANEPVETYNLTWLIASRGETMIRMRESEYFWIFRLTRPNSTIDEINVALAEKIRSYQQIFLK